MDYLIKPVEPEKLVSTVHKAAQAHVLFKD